jgi:hypothetical protein
MDNPSKLALTAIFVMILHFNYVILFVNQRR